jgi:hypothetical protein
MDPMAKVSPAPTRPTAPAEAGDSLLSLLHDGAIESLFQATGRLMRGSCDLAGPLATRQQRSSFEQLPRLLALAGELHGLANQLEAEVAAADALVKPSC